MLCYIYVLKNLRTKMFHLKRHIMFFLMIFSAVYFMLCIYLNYPSHLQARHKILFSGYSRLDTISRQKSDTCKSARTNFVFTKCMKCATETMGSILRRFGYVRNLNFVLPIKRNIYLGWPFPIETSDIRPSKFEYNILMEHSVFNYSFLQEMMPNDSVYITIIRNPWDQFKSTYNYFDVGVIGSVPNESIETYLENIDYHENIYKSPEKNSRRFCVPEGFSITRNLQSHCLGVPLGFPAGGEDVRGNELAAKDYISRLEETFTLVMLVDYFTESLILLKRTMCWSLKDILYHHSNVGKYKDTRLKELKPEGHYYQLHSNWSRIDYLLFNHFNKTLWKKIEAEGAGFYEEVQHFRLVQMLMERFCFIEERWRFPDNFITIPESRFSGKFNISGEDCVLMNTYMLPLLWSSFYKREGISPDDFEGVEKKRKPVKGCSIN